MGFANPWGLLALAALPLVVLLHRRFAAPRRAVPLVTLWAPRAAATRGGPRRPRLDGILVLRLLVVAAVALALGRPGWPVAERYRHVLVLDASASMLAREASGVRFRQAVGAAERALAALPSGEPAMILRAGAAASIVHAFSEDRRSLRAALQGLAPGETPKNLGPAFAEAARHLGGAPGVVHVFSDAPDGAALAHLAARAGLSPDALDLQPVGGPADNVAIVALAAAPAPGSPLDHEVFAGIASFASSSRTVGVALHAPDGLRERRRVALAPGGREGVVFLVPPVPWVEVRLEGAADALSADDRAALVLPQVPLRVLYASRGDPFVGAALSAHPGLHVSEIPVAGLSASLASLPPADVAVIDGAGLPRGFPLPALIVASGDGAPERARVVPITDWQRGHPILRRLDLAEVFVPAGAVLTAPPGAAASPPLIRSADGPVARAWEEGGRRRLELAFAIRRSNLGELPVFPVMVARALEWLAGGAVARPLNLRAGTPARIDVPPGAGEVAVHRPDGSTVRLAAREGLLTIAPTDLVGRWEVAAAGARVTFAVNLLDAGESNVDRRRLDPDATVGMSRRGSAAPAATGWRDLHRWVLAIALLLLSVEIWLVACARAARSSMIRLRSFTTASAVRRGAAWLCLALALAGPELVIGGAPESVVVALDVSASTGRSLAGAVERLDRLVRALPAATPVGVVAFAADAYVVRTPSSGRDVAVADLQRLAAEPDAVVRVAERDETDLARALARAAEALPPGEGGRVVLASDGWQTRGDARGALAALAARGVAVDVLALGDLSPGLRDAAVEEVEAPAQVLEGVPFDLSAVVRSTVEDTATVTLLDADRPVARQEVRLTAGLTPVRFAVDPPVRGERRYAVRVTLDGDRDARNDQAGAAVNVLGRPRVLWVSGERPVRDPALEIVPVRAEALASAMAELDGFDAVVIADVPAESLPEGALERFRRYVGSEGGGLLMAGGLGSFGPGGYRGTAIEDVLPVDLDPARRSAQAAQALVLVLDTSGSMADSFGRGAKIDAARDAATVVTSLLEPGDRFGIVAFSGAPAPVVPLREPPGREALHLILSRLRPGGGTRILPALAEAAAMLRGAPAPRRHVVLVTDGRGEGGDFERHGREMARAGVTVSVVAVGDDADVDVLRALARGGRGRFEVARDSAKLGAALRREAVLGRSAVVREEPTRVVPSPHPVLGDLATARVPELAGYVSTAAKAFAAVPLRAEGGDPILALGAFGLGRAAALTTDVGGPWSQAWLRWDGAPRLWGRLLRWILRAPVAGHLTILETRAAAPGGREEGRSTLAVRVEDREGNRLNGLRLGARLQTGADERAVALEQRGPGLYEAALDERVGRPTRVIIEERADRGSGTVSAAGQGWIGLGYPDDYRVRGPNRLLLAELGRATGGVSLDDPRATLVPRTTARRQVALGPWLAVAGLALFMAELAFTSGAGRVLGREPTAAPGPGRSPGRASPA